MAYQSPAPDTDKASVTNSVEKYSPTTFCEVSEKSKGSNGESSMPVEHFRIS